MISKQNKKDYNDNIQIKTEKNFIKLNYRYTRVYCMNCYFIYNNY